jgi:RNA polymerase sigma factor (sigma-70 family)
MDRTDLLMLSEQDRLLWLAKQVESTAADAIERLRGEGVPFPTGFGPEEVTEFFDWLVRLPENSPPGKDYGVPKSWDAIWTKFTEDDKARDRFNDLLLSLGCEKQQEWKKGRTIRQSEAGAMVDFVHGKYWHSSLRILQGKGNLHGDPEELLQKAFVGMVSGNWSEKSRARFRGSARIGNCLISNVLRGHEPRVEAVQRFVQLSSVAENALIKDPGSQGPIAIDSSALHTCIQELTFAQVQVLDLFYIKGYTLVEIAEILDCSDSNVKQHLNRAHARLRKCLEGKGIRALKEILM